MISGLSLIKIEEKLKERLFDCEIISDVKLSYEEFIYLENNLRKVFININEISILKRCIENFKVSVANSENVVSRIRTSEEEMISKYK